MRFLFHQHINARALERRGGIAQTYSGCTQRFVFACYTWNAWPGGGGRLKSPLARQLQTCIYSATSSSIYFLDSFVREQQVTDVAALGFRHEGLLRHFSALQPSRQVASSILGATFWYRIICVYMFVCVYLNLYHFSIGVQMYSMLVKHQTVYIIYHALYCK